ncbi:MAG: hypothetical protein Q4F67_12185 [Propionibacteriaceae bacterium]|nr:hypothetical protein [Propionibacteriaceae bacterium]
MPIYADYRIPKELLPRPQKAGGVAWRDVWGRFDLIELDMLEHYGIDWHDPALERPWPWWRDRVNGLLGADTRLARALSSGRS